MDRERGRVIDDQYKSPLAILFDTVIDCKNPTWWCNRAEKRASTEVHADVSFFDFVNGKVDYHRAKSDENDSYRRRRRSHDGNDGDEDLSNR